MALTSDSTTAECWAQYDDNVSYDLNGSVAQAKLFIEACRILLRRVPDEMYHGGQGADSYKNSPSKLQKALDEALAWWRANDTSANTSAGGGGAVFFDFAEFRR